MEWFPIYMALKDYIKMLTVENPNSDIPLTFRKNSQCVAHVYPTG